MVEPGNTGGKALLTGLFYFGYICGQYFSHMIKNTPFTEKHIALGAKMVPFAGYNMPISYTGINDEHAAVRKNAGVFDVSHMGEFFLKGPHALDLIHAASVLDLPQIYRRAGIVADVGAGSRAGCPAGADRDSLAPAFSAHWPGRCPGLCPFAHADGSCWLPSWKAGCPADGCRYGSRLFLSPATSYA